MKQKYKNFCYLLHVEGGRKGDHEIVHISLNFIPVEDEKKEEFVSLIRKRKQLASYFYGYFMHVTDEDDAIFSHLIFNIDI